MNVIDSKREFFRLREHGCVGNQLRMWTSISDVLQSDAEWIGFRELRTGAGSGLHEVVRRFAAYETNIRWFQEGRRFIIDEAAPDHLVQLQGEVCRTIRGWEGSLAIRSGVRMREAMSAGLLKPMVGLVVPTLLDHFVDPASRDDIDVLLQMYPEATIEFAAYSCNLGFLPGRNTLIWEVRNY